MNIIKQYSAILTPSQELIQFPQRIEFAGRVAYKSEYRVTDTSATAFVRGLIRRGHESVLEHCSFTVRFVTDRGISHELVRHRIASFTQESTRYCNYSSESFAKGITVIQPFFLEEDGLLYLDWLKAMHQSEEAYLKMIEFGATPQEARGVLPNSLKTEVIMTANIREWRHILTLRMARDAHPQMRELMHDLHERLMGIIPVFFEDLPRSME